VPVDSATSISSISGSRCAPARFARQLYELLAKALLQPSLSRDLNRKQTTRRNQVSNATIARFSSTRGSTVTQDEGFGRQTRIGGNMRSIYPSDLSVGILCMSAFVAMLFERVSREKYSVTRVDSINISKLRICFDDALHIHFRAQMTERQSFDCVATLYGKSDHMPGFAVFTIWTLRTVLPADKRPGCTVRYFAIGRLRCRQIGRLA
jgi:hypothetical protein